jgi:flagellar capping protein FliD
MKKKNTTEPQYVTKEILKKEISKSENRLNTRIDGVEQRLDAKIDGVEQRLDAKIDAKVDSAVQSMKDYTDSRFTQLDTKVDGLAQKMETRFEKFERYFEQLMGMFVQQNKKIDTSLKQLKNHEQRITK